MTKLQTSNGDVLVGLQGLPENAGDIPPVREDLPIAPEGRGNVEQNQLLDVERKARFEAERV